LEATGSSDGSPNTVFRGRLLFLARVAWAAVAVLTVGLFVAGVPSEFARLQTVCADAIACVWFPQLTPEKVRELKELGLSLDLFAAYFVAVEVVLASVSFVVGAIIFWRKSDEWMGIFVSLTLLTFGPSVTTLYALSELHSAWKLPAESVSFLGIALVTLFFYIFPDGRFAPRWTRWSAVAAIALEAPMIFFTQSSLSLFRYPPLYTLVAIGFFGSVLFAQTYRYLRVSAPLQRQQTKWVVFGIAAALGGFFWIILLDLILSSPGVLASLAGNTGLFLSMLLIPLSIGVAGLRYRLYDIDLLINRTLVYGALTVLLGATYYGGVVLLQQRLRVLTGQGSTLAVVASTLTIAALFNPLRRRVQSFIDRRFYRRKYDARKTLEAFSAKLRDETDLDALSEDLVGVVRETMQPAYVSLWLRPDAPPKGKRAGQQPFIHRSAWKRSSANFACKGFSEGRIAPVRYLEGSPDRSSTSDSTSHKYYGPR
jgi:hypothetical protein